MGGEAGQEQDHHQQGGLRWAARLFRKFPHTCVALAIVGFIVRLTVRDRVPLIATFYYALPGVVQGGLLMAAAAAWGWGRKWRLALPYLVAAVALLVWWHATLYFSNGHGQQARPRVVFWNIARGRLGYELIVEELKRNDPDVIALVEAGRKDDLPFWMKQFPEYRRSDFSGGVLIFVRGSIEDQLYIKFDSGRCKSARVSAGGVSFRFVVVDLVSNPLSWRKKPLRELEAILNRWKDEPLVVVGDFNTPADSVFFDSWREKLKHGFETAGQGYFATWPSPLPVQAIDHVWLGRSLKSNQCRLIDTLLSDHRLIEFDLMPTQ